MPSPLVLISVNGGPFNPTGLNGLDVAFGGTIAVVLQSPSGVANWYLQVGLVTGNPPVATPGTGTDETQVSPPPLTGVNGAGLVIGGPTATVTFTFPGVGTALLFSSTITGTFGVITTTFALFARTTGGYRVGPAGLTREGSTAYGWTTIVNPAIRQIGSGGGATVIFRPGGVASGNVYATWATAHAAAVASNATTIFVDSSIATATITSGTWNMLGINLAAYQSNQPINAVDFVNIADGGTLQDLATITGGLWVTCACVTTAAFTFSYPNSSSFLNINTGYIALNAGALVPAISIPAANFLYIDISFQATALDNGSAPTVPLINVAATAGLYVYGAEGTYGAANFGTGDEIGGPAGSLWQYAHDDTLSGLIITNTLFSGTFTNVKSSILSEGSSVIAGGGLAADGYITTADGAGNVTWAQNIAIGLTGGSLWFTRPVLAALASTPNGSVNPLKIGVLLFKPSDEGVGTRQVWFRVILETTGALYQANIDLVDVNNVLGNGVGAEVPGSLLQTTNTTATELEVRLNTVGGNLETLSPNILLFARIWLTTTLVGQSVTCSGASLNVERN